MRPRVALGLTLNIFWFYLGASPTVFNPDFTRLIQKSADTSGHIINNAVQTAHSTRFSAHSTVTVCPAHRILCSSYWTQHYVLYTLMQK